MAGLIATLVLLLAGSLLFAGSVLRQLKTVRTDRDAYRRAHADVSTKLGEEQAECRRLRSALAEADARAWPKDDADMRAAGCP